MLLAAAIRTACREEAWTRIEELYQLAGRFTEGGEWRFQSLVEGLRELFAADAVTMLLKEQEELRLSASTDPGLYADEKAPVVYRAGESLTWHVFRGHLLRLKDTRDRLEVYRHTGLQRVGPTFPEHDEKGEIMGQFLGAPMRSGGGVVGVLRMLRRHWVSRFTREDEKSLQLFADLVGAALAPAWDLLLERAITETTSEAIVISRRELRQDGTPVARIVAANAGAEKLLGRTRQELVGMEATEIYSSDDYHSVLTALRQAHREGEVELGPIPGLRKRADGSLIPVTVSYRLLDNTLVRPPSRYTVSLARDASESERMADQYQYLLELLDKLGVAYFSSTLEGFTQNPTQTECRLTGYSYSEFKTISRRNLFAAPSARDTLVGAARAAEEGWVSGQLLQMRRKDGTLFWSQGDLRIMRDSHGSEVGTEGIYRDVTERVTLQGWLDAPTERILSDFELYERLRQQSHFQVDYLTSLGHQLLTPLAALTGTLRNFEERVLSRQELLHQIPYLRGQAVVCTRLVRNLSYMDKILRGEPFDKVWVPLSGLTVETAIDFSHLLKEMDLRLEIDRESLTRHLRVQGHKEMMRQVVVNLVDNAIKYSLPGTEIRIRARVWPEGPSFEISNRGLPIPEVDREKVFERGFRTKKAQAAVPHGTGLGLWLVRKIVEAHGARIRCGEEVENGQRRTVFQIVFPQPTDTSPRRP
jgi:PAS domain S-box-containing protein